MKSAASGRKRKLDGRNVKRVVLAGGNKEKKKVREERTTNRKEGISGCRSRKGRSEVIPLKGSGGRENTAFLFTFKENKAF